MRRAVPAPDALSYLLAAHVWAATPDVRFTGRYAKALNGCARFVASHVARLRGLQ